MNNILQIFDLKQSTDYKATDEYIRNNVEFKRENAWALIGSIFIASIGLNVNSTAVIIGAMLISPLMGPIIGAGYSLAIEDLILFRKSIKSFITFVIISLVTSIIYFTLSPFTSAQSELIARTQPTIYDILIAIFGGIVGIVALSRQEKGNAIPGVAIATALMPPLCTVGYGVTQGNIQFFLGASYLFSCNVLFIALSTFIIVRYLNFKEHLFREENQKKKLNVWAILLIFLFTTPGIGIAWYLKLKNNFNNNVNNFIQEELIEQNIFVSRKEEIFSLNKPTLKLYTIGKTLGNHEINELKNKLLKYELENTSLTVTDVLSLTNSNKKSLNLGKTENQRLQSEIKELKSKLDLIDNNNEFIINLKNELKILNLKIVNVSINHEQEIQITLNKRISQNEKSQIINFIKLKGEYKLVFLQLVY